MGKFQLPSISKLEEVLDLLLDPEKYKQYMVEFKDAYDQASARLGDVDTKIKAEQYLAKATQANQDAVAYLITTKEKLALAKQQLESVQQKEEEVLAVKLQYEALIEEVTKKAARLEENNTFHEHLQERQRQELVDAKTAFQDQRVAFAKKVEEFETRVQKLSSVIGEV